jgi:hypothetical protein
MSIQTQTTSQAEHDWYATRSGLPTEAPLNDHKVTYFGTKGFGGNMSIAKNVNELENEWLTNVGNSTQNWPLGIWQDACQAQSVPVGTTIDECKRNFYTSVASGTNP